MNTKEFEVSVVITAFRIGPVLSDTIQSVMSQYDVNFGNIVVVVDGCGYTNTTRKTLSRFSRGYNGLVQFVWVENGGVSRARNIGARWILENRPNTGGIYYIDGDDLLNPLAISKSVEALLEAQADKPQENIGWTYCNQNQFGDDTPSLEYPRNAIPNRWLSNNLSQPSCLIDRKMFDAGVFWDEDMRKGIEDWEYWLTAIEAGFIGTNVRDVYLRYRRLTGNRSSLNRANDAITKDYMRNKHKALYTADFFLDNEHALFPRWAFSRYESPMTFDVGTDIGLPMASRDHDYLRQALSYRFSIGKIDTTILEPYFPDMIAFIDPSDSEILNELKMTPAILREMEEIVSKHGWCTLTVSGSEQQADLSYDHVEEIQVTTEISTPDSLAKRQFSSYFMSIRKVFELLKLSDKNLSDVQVLNIISLWSPKHLHVSVAGLDVPVRGEPLPGQSASARLDSLVVELHRIFRLPASLSLLQRDRHNLCGSHMASHDKLGTDILGVWPILPKLKCGKQQIGILVTEHSKFRLDDVISDIGSVVTDLDFEINVLILGKTSIVTDLVDNPMISSIGFMDKSLEMPVLKQHNGYLGVPAYEMLNEHKQREILGYLASMDVVIDLCGPRAAGIMMNLKARGVHTSTCITNVNAQEFLEYSVTDAVENDDVIEELKTDPVAIQAYSGAYKSLIVPSSVDAEKLVSYGVTPSTMVRSSTVLLTEIFNTMVSDAEMQAIHAADTDNDPSASDRSLAA